MIENIMKCNENRPKCRENCSKSYLKFIEKTVCKSVKLI